ncbi:cell division protein FtsZ [Dokdonia pacifica]|uniref:Cell division protein FtsZ n=1 Tax=Dokdonia pacifica TaxID=1627892 RepID=A0A239CAH6_9FLAO|nr:cell division protein FtsZ [Dokdonia pacifica]GGG26082.1 cell division protein FtsZ [Dokdonia pacifica]SNS16678.1 cell division protein FtsZ [Dokdonia pacifica]
MSTTEFDGITFDLPKNQSNVIKVIGVGGGGSNAINHMFHQGIKGVDFVICNTDAQALENSTVPIKIQLGVGLTEGLGAGANPEVGEQAAIESELDIKEMLGANTKMIFITAGMGGGTGTGAAPIIAKMAREMEILVVGIVTIPFQFEGKMRNEQAQRGVDRLRSQVDSLIVINNNKLREVYGNLGFKAGFSKADEVLATASRGIAEVITHHYTQNIDLRDAKTVLSNSGTAIMGSSTASGSNRAFEAITKALDSPLLNDNKITGAKNVLLLIVSGSDEITIDEIGEINDHIQAEAGNSANIIMGVGEDEALGDAISVTIIATGFNVEQQDDIVNVESKKIIHTLEEEQKAQHDLMPEATVQEASSLLEEVVPETPEVEEVVVPEKIVHTLDLDDFEEKPSAPVHKDAVDLKMIPTTDIIRDIDVVYEEVLAASEDDFEIIDTTVRQEETTFEEKESVQEEVTGMLSFDLPMHVEEEPVKKEEVEAPVLFDLDEDIVDIEVKDAIEIIPVTELSTEGEKRYSLEDYMEVEENLASAKVSETEGTQVEEETIVFEKKTVAPEEVSEEQKEEEVDPMNSPISKLLIDRAAERKRKMKEFNYKFHHNQSRIEEIEKQPAYKRMGIDLDDKTPDKEGNLSRTTLSTDDNEDIQLRSNNSFLHDNVD